jgi:hypothetical protein
MGGWGKSRSEDHSELITSVRSKVSCTSKQQIISKHKERFSFQAYK